MIRKSAPWLIAMVFGIGISCLPALELQRASGAGRPAAEQASSSRSIDGEGLNNLMTVLHRARTGQSGAVEDYLSLTRNSGLSIPEWLDLATESQAILDQFRLLSMVVEDSRRTAATILGNTSYDESSLFDSMERTASSFVDPLPHLADEALHLIAEARSDAETLLAMRENLFETYQNEAVAGEVSDGTRLAWSLLRIASGLSEAALKPGALDYGPEHATLRFMYKGMPVVCSLSTDDMDDTFRAEINGYAFTANWALLLQKPFTWMAALADDMTAAGIDPEQWPEWNVLEGPGEPIAIAYDGARPVQAFVFGDSHRIDLLPKPSDMSDLTDSFTEAASRLHQGIMNDASIARPLRNALHPVLAGTYQPVDPRDYFDSAFCRRLIEADYLEKHVPSLSADRLAELAEYREALDRLERGFDEFVITMDDGGRLYASVTLDSYFFQEEARAASDQDEVFEDGSHGYEWRLHSNGKTTFFSPLPERAFYGLILAEQYHGDVSAKPSGAPARSDISHPLFGVLATYRDGDAAASGDPESWQLALEHDVRGGRGAGSMPIGWNFPLHVLVRDEEGDPLRLAVPGGVLDSPDFSGITSPAALRHAQDAWLDEAARVLDTPNQLGLLFYQFFRYCSDSPLPEMPNLIGSHHGLSDTHQTVYESLDRRWVGRLIGDCDDLAEFFQVVTQRQGKLSHVMHLPGHAAAGYVELEDDGLYHFYVLQTGPVMHFADETLTGAVEKAYRSFERAEGETRFTPAAVPLLLRFADEDTRTSFVLSSRIYEDPDYAAAMIQVQEYWHKHVFSAGIPVMERMIEQDRQAGSTELGNIKELASLYERVGWYDESVALRLMEIEEAGDDVQTRISTMLDIVNLHVQNKNTDAAVDLLDEIREMFSSIRDSDPQAFGRLGSFRIYWAMLMARVEQPWQAWQFMREDVEAAKTASGAIPEPFLRIMVILHDRMSMLVEPTDQSATTLTASQRLSVREELESEIGQAFSHRWFKRNDAYNSVIGKYYFLGRYAIAQEGRAEGLAKLMRDGPYAEETRDHSDRARAVTDEDWSWFRITPRLYLSYALEMLDQEEYPELFDPETAGILLQMVNRAVEQGAGLGSDVAGGEDALQADIILSFVKNDLEAFRRVMAVVLEKNYASLYDDAAMAFGNHCGLIPLEDFAGWVDAFAEFLPGKQHYFKVVYRAIDKENDQHALKMAEAAARIYADDQLLVDEAEFVRNRLAGHVDTDPELPVPATEKAEESLAA